MSAEILREAAALMRERAEGAADRSPSPWLLGTEDPTGKVFAAGVVTLTDHNEELSVAEGFSAQECQHIASWHPAVALAVADWLDATAAEHESDAVDPRLCEFFAEFNTAADIAAITVATAYLGQEAS